MQKRLSIRQQRKSQPALVEYRRKLKNEVAARLPKPLSWFDLWHMHVDWDGVGRISRAHRRIEVWAIIRLLQRIQALLARRQFDSQVFACIYENEPESDAVYIHTANPNGTKFPHDPEVLAWLEKLPVLLSGLLSLEHYRVGLCMFDGNRYYYLERRAK